MELEVEVNKLNVLRTAYKNEQYHLQDEIRIIPDKITDKERLLAALQQDGRTFAAHHAESVGDTFRAEISGTVYTQKEDAGNALLAAHRKRNGKDQGWGGRCPGVGKSPFLSGITAVLNYT